MTTVTGLYKGFEKNDAGFITCIIENTGLEVQPGTRTKYFNHGKVAPKIASGTTVEFEYTSKDHENGKTYYTVKGPLKEVAGASPTAQGEAPRAIIPHSGSTNNSIEAQVAVKEASETLRHLISTGLSAVTPDNAGLLIAKIAAPLISLMSGQKPPAAPAPKPKPAPKPEPEDENQDPPY